MEGTSQQQEGEQEEITEIVSYAKGIAGAESKVVVRLVLSFSGVHSLKTIAPGFPSLK